MHPQTFPRLGLSILCLLVPLGAARADEPSKSSKPSKPSQAASLPAVLPGVGLLDAMRSGAVAVAAEGTGDGNMAIIVTNNTTRKLRVVLPPGLVASGATGQFGGMGGMGMGGMGGGMGGMGGGMGGGMRGGMGGGMGSRGGMMGGRGGSQMLTMPPSMGMMMLGRLIMTLVEPTESWNPRTLMMGMMMGRMGMGGMGGGMGGMGGMMGGMGGMGMGMRSVPPTDLPDATFKPGQTRRLSTRLVSLNPPSPEVGVAMPQAGERLLIGDIAQLGADPKVQKALRRLAADKAPENVAQLVLWNVAGKLDWAIIAQLADGWVNVQELALARQFVERLDTLPEGESGQLFVQFIARESAHEALAADLDKILGDRTVLGLKAASAIPSQPAGPSVGCKIQIIGPPDKPEAIIQVAESDGLRRWKSMGKFGLTIPTSDQGPPDLAAFYDNLSEGVLARLVHVKLIKLRNGAVGQVNYTLQVDNASPLILNGFALRGTLSKPGEPPHYLLGIGLTPQRSLQMQLTAGMVETYGMKKGTQLVALDLSAL